MRTLIAAPPRRESLLMDGQRQSLTSFVTLVPDTFFPSIGRVLVSHAFADRELSKAINFHSGMDRGAGVAVLSAVTSTADRAKMLKNLARVRAKTLAELCKYLVLADLMKTLSESRNVIAHNIPYMWSPSNGEISYHKDTTLVFPQITQEAAFSTTIAKLEKLADELMRTGTWLGIALPGCVPDGVSVAGKTAQEIHDLLIEHAGCHPDWQDDKQFPWQTQWKRRLKEERKKPQNADKE